MGQRHQQSNAGTDGSAWLSTLIETFERTEQLERVPCDGEALAGAKARLQRPATSARRNISRRHISFELQH